MTKCVFRTDLKLQPVGKPLFCIDPIHMFLRPDMPTIERCVQMLLTADEICLGGTDQRTIMQGPRPVGYIRIVEECAWIPGAVTRRCTEGG